MVIIAGPLGAGKGLLHKKVKFDDNLRLAMVDHRCALELAREFKKRPLTLSDYLGVGKTLSTEILRQLSFRPAQILVEMPLDHIAQVNTISAAKELGYTTELYFVGTESADINFERTKACYEKIFEQPRAIIKHSYRESLEKAAIALRLADSGQVFDNSK